MNENETFITLGLLGELGHVNVSLSLLLRRGHCKCNAREIGIGFKNKESFVICYFSKEVEMRAVRRKRRGFIYSCWGKEGVMLKIEQVGGNKRPDLDRPFGKVCFNV